MPPALTLETERLRGEPVGPQHLDPLCALLGDPRVGETLGGVRDRAEVAATIERAQALWDRDGFGPRTWLDRASGAVVARGGLASTVVEGEPVVELTWAVAPDRWRQGIATELASSQVDR